MYSDEKNKKTTIPIGILFIEFFANDKLFCSETLIGESESSKEAELDL